VCVRVGELMSVDDLSGAECLSVDEALRLSLSPLDLSDLQLLTDQSDWLTDAADAEQQLRLDNHHIHHQRLT